MVGRHQQLIFFSYVVEPPKVSDSHWFVWKNYIPPSDLAWDSMVEGIFLITKWAVKSSLTFVPSRGTHPPLYNSNIHTFPAVASSWVLKRTHSAAIESCNRCPVTTHSWSLEEFPAKTPQDPRHPQLIRMFIEYRNEILEDMILCEVNPEQDAGWKRDLMDVDGFRLKSFSSKLHRSWSLGVL